MAAEWLAHPEPKPGVTWSVVDRFTLEAVWEDAEGEPEVVVKQDAELQPEVESVSARMDGGMAVKAAVYADLAAQYHRAAERLERVDLPQANIAVQYLRFTAAKLVEMAECHQACPPSG
ncbi:MAG: hypothetical protein K6T83_17350 [Alicyclobacillus sp.]|nr:hypothetical protein [Alicyclobacillus sp.]